MSHCRELEVTLPNGPPGVHGGPCTARVRGITESDEGLVTELGSCNFPLDRATMLLTRCVTQLGECRSPDVETLNELSLGDREALLLHVRRMTFGERLTCLLECPSCAETLELQLDIGQLLVPASVEPQACYQEVLAIGDAQFQVTFRTPKAKDVVAVLEAAGSGPEAAAQALLLACVDEVSQLSGSATSVALAPENWPQQLVAKIAARMEALDPQAEILLATQCTACRQNFSTSFDSGNYLFQELQSWQRRLYLEVHQLARAYHWSEAEILSMPLRKRRLYLDLLLAESTYE